MWVDLRLVMERSWNALKRPWSCARIWPLCTSPTAGIQVVTGRQDPVLMLIERWLVVASPALERNERSLVLRCSQPGLLYSSWSPPFWLSLFVRSQVSDHQDVELLLESFGMQLEDRPERHRETGGDLKFDEMVSARGFFEVPIVLLVANLGLSENLTTNFGLKSDCEDHEGSLGGLYIQSRIYVIGFKSCKRAAWPHFGWHFKSHEMSSK